MDIEKRSIEFVPHAERYGHPKRLFTIWFSANMQVTTLVVGTLGIVAGLNLAWTCLALVLGCAIGTVFMAAHSSQGPHLGIPQMIQSRAQFGVLGAGFPLLINYLAFVLFTAANGVVMRDSIKAFLDVGDNTAIVLFGVISFVVGFIGYELIHRFGVIMSALSGLLFLVVAVLALQKPLPVGALELTDTFKFTAFALTVTQAASWTLGFGPYVADYSRYLPVNISSRQTFWYSYLGNLLGAGLVMLLGALLATLIKDVTNDPGSAIGSFFGPWSKVAMVVVVLGVIEINSLNLYSAYMSGMTIFTGMRGMTRISRGTKFIAMGLTAIAATWIAVQTQYNFFAYFSDILIAQVYFLVPWSAINLADFYLVRKGKYAVDDMYNVDGQYGKYNISTMVIYLLGVLSTLPFMDMSFYHSYFAQILGSDQSWIPALIVPAGLYYWWNRKRVAVPAVALQSVV
ncbi:MULTISPECIES: cytosine permease [unclassified Pseudomonas]|uniref:purine-cytosine permease family protein n=1 Tax=unclassified Pseudomonas TaxID=196821 RepID=UPI000730C11D|nr:MULTISPECIES: cytosine permease [unclassified Pseudomonas]KSW22213.1 permease [Pseudomonas sp. ADP]OBP10339.1 permease [Pseudomonas sp. EGD-AKN5]QOF85006.1 cytosine permease [Pseudomonas sp. ADPe]